MKSNVLQFSLVILAIVFSSHGFAGSKKAICLGNSQVDQKVPFIVTVVGTPLEFKKFVKALEVESEGIRIESTFPLLQIVSIAPNWSELHFPPVLGFDQNSAAENLVRSEIARISHAHQVDAHLDCNTIMGPQPSVGGAN